MRHLRTIGLTTPLVGLGCAAFLVLWQRAPHRLPGPLIMVVASALVVRLASLDTPTIATRYGEFPRSFPLPSLRFVMNLGVGEWIDLVPLAVAIAVLAAVESLLSAVVAASWPRQVDAMTLTANCSGRVSRISCHRSWAASRRPPRSRARQQASAPARHRGSRASHMRSRSSSSRSLSAGWAGRSH